MTVATSRAGWEHFSHDADVGVRGFGLTAPGACKDLAAVVGAAEQAGLARRVA